MRLAIAFVLACSSPVASIQNTTAPKPLPELPADELLGVLALVRDPDSGMEARTTVIVPNKEGMSPDGWRAYDSKGASTGGQFLPVTQIQYGCDNNQLEVTPFQSSGSVKLQRGVAWLLQEYVTLEPKPVAIWAVNDTSAEARSYVIGSVGLQLVRTSANRGTVAISWQGRRVHELPIERSEMAGADMSPLNLTGEGVAVPVPEAAWKLGNGGAILLVLKTKGYEGTTYTTIVVNDRAARTVERMTMYLYYCAF